MAFNQKVFQSGDTISSEFLTNISGAVARLLKHIVIEYKTTDDITVDAGDVGVGKLGQVTMDITKEGYTPVGLINEVSYNSQDEGLGCSFISTYGRYVKENTDDTFSAIFKFRSYATTGGAKFFYGYYVVYLCDDIDVTEDTDTVTQDEVNAICQAYLDEHAVTDVDQTVLDAELEEVFS